MNKDNVLKVLWLSDSHKTPEKVKELEKCCECEYRGTSLAINEEILVLEDIDECNVFIKYFLERISKADIFVFDQLYSYTSMEDMIANQLYMKNIFTPMVVPIKDMSFGKIDKNIFLGWRQVKVEITRKDFELPPF